MKFSGAKIIKRLLLTISRKGEKAEGARERKREEARV